MKRKVNSQQKDTVHTKKTKLDNKESKNENLKENSSTLKRKLDRNKVRDQQQEKTPIKKVQKRNKQLKDDAEPKQKDSSDESKFTKVGKKSNKLLKDKPKGKQSSDESKFTKVGKRSSIIGFKKDVTKKITDNNKESFSKENWTEFKKKKKELRVKRKQSKNNYDVITEAKKMGEELRRKILKGGEEKRVQLINQLHNILKEKGHYPKFVLSHDTARLVQWLLKYSSNIVVQQISKELIPVTTDMIQSKYGVHCVKRLLKYGSAETRSQIIDSFYGHAVKLASHAVSAPVLEYAVLTWATPIQKQYLVQEFYGDLYKNSKDADIKHLRDTYKSDESLKTAILSATKANVMKIINKSLLDSILFQSVIYQFLTDCSEEDRKELISFLAPHIVVISNSKDGARAAMQCIWKGTNKDKKVILKALKGQDQEQEEEKQEQLSGSPALDLSKHEHGHCVIITLLDSTDDTVLLRKILLAPLLENAKDLAVSEWGRKVLLWLVAPADSTKFHPLFIAELKEGREASTSKKAVDIRRKELLEHSISALLNLIITDAQFWLSNASLATVMNAIIKAGSGEDLEKAYNSIVDVITNMEWKVKENDTDIAGIEHAGMHMILKKLAQHDKLNLNNGNPTFGSSLAEKLTNDVLLEWLKLNRGCFVLITAFENGSEETQNKLKKKLKTHSKLLKQQDTPGAKILLKKLK